MTFTHWHERRAEVTANHRIRDEIMRMAEELKGVGCDMRTANIREERLPDRPVAVVTVRALGPTPV